MPFASVFGCFSSDRAARNRRSQDKTEGERIDTLTQHVAQLQDQLQQFIDAPSRENDQPTARSIAQSGAAASVQPPESCVQASGALQPGAAAAKPAPAKGTAACQPQGAPAASHHQGRFYAVQVGRAPGVYTQLDEALRQVHRFPRFRMKKFPTLEKAKAYVDGNVNGAPVQVPPGQRFYGVRSGRTPGVFTDFTEVLSSTYGFGGHCFKAFDTQQEAQAFVTGKVATKVWIYWDAENISYNLAVYQKVLAGVHANLIRKQQAKHSGDAAAKKVWPLQIMEINVFACARSPLASSTRFLQGKPQRGGVLHMDLSGTQTNWTDARLIETALKTVVALPGPLDACVFVVVSNDRGFEALYNALGVVVPALVVLCARHGGNGAVSVSEWKL